MSAIVIDGSVLCGVDAGKRFDYSRLRVAAETVYEACGHRDVNLKIFVDASLRWKLDPTDKSNLENDISAGRVEQTPAGLPADPFILRWAEAHGAIVITNDLYRDWVNDFPWVGQPGSGRFVSGVFDQQAKTWTFLERHASGSPRTLGQLLGSTTPIPTTDKFVDPTTGRYCAEIKRGQPSAFVFLVDQSASMNEMWIGGRRKSAGLSDIVDDCLVELILQCTRPGEVRDYLDIAIIGYGGDGKEAIRTELPGTTVTRPFVSISQIHQLGKKNLNHDTGQPSWLLPRADGSTPMTAALTAAKEAVESWAQEHQNSYPPIIFNITDGEPTDGEPADAAAELTKITTKDGNALLFVAHISGTGSSSLQYPEHLEEGALPALRRMFNISSHLPETMRRTAQGLGLGADILPASRGFLYNASAVDLIALLEIGSTAAMSNIAPEAK